MTEYTKEEHFYTSVLYHDLPEDAMEIRQEVFVLEQGFLEEFDKVDYSARHLVMYDGKTPVGCGRYFVEDGDYIIGRLAVRKIYRGQNLGREILLRMEQGCPHIWMEKILAKGEQKEL